MTEDQIKEAGHLFAKRICDLGRIGVGDLLVHIGAFMSAREREDVDDLEGIRRAIAELLAPEIIGDVKDGPPKY